MLFNSYQFTFGFLPVIVVGFALLSSLGVNRLTAGFLIAASLFFYGWWNWVYLFLFGSSIAFNFLWSLMLTPKPGESAAHQRRRGILLGVGSAVNVALLGYFKYRNFVVGSIWALTGAKGEMAPLVLPLAISFFTFEQITFLSSAYRGEAGSREFGSYLLFITFFPHLIAGPIVRFNQIYPQLNLGSRFRLSYDNLSAGLMIFAIGLFKKVIIADSFRSVANRVFDGSGFVASRDAWAGAFAFALQIYFDFSGYSDMAIGLARMFGVQFPENFDSPYKALDVISFWRRWHITLSFFLRDYLYIPMGGNRRGELRRHLNLFVTMLLGGLWHGANWTFVAWGALHGAFLSINHLWARTRRPMPAAFAWALTFTAVLVAWVFFRAPTFARAGIILRGMAGLAPPMPHLFKLRELRGLVAGLFIVLLCPNRQQIMEWEWKSDWAYGAAFAALCAVSIMSMSNPPPFIYFQF